MANNKLYFFTANSVAQAVVPANPQRRRVNYYSYAPPDAVDGNTIWLDDTGNAAVAFQCKQIVAGQTWEYGGSDDSSVHLHLRFQSCPTGAISVICMTGTHKGLIEEFS